MSCGLRDVISYEVHGSVHVLLGLFLCRILVKPLLSDSLSLSSVILALSHAEGIRHCDIVLALAALGHHVLLIHQLLFELSLHTPFDLLGVFILVACSLCPCSVDVLDRESAKNHLLSGSQFTALCEIDHESIPSDPIALIIF